MKVFKTWRKVQVPIYCRLIGVNGIMGKGENPSPLCIQRFFSIFFLSSRYFLPFFTNFRFLPLVFSDFFWINSTERGMQLLISILHPPLLIAFLSVTWGKCEWIEYHSQHLIAFSITRAIQVNTFYVIHFNCYFFRNLA